MTSLHSWQLAARTTERSLQRATTLLSTLRKEETAQLFASREWYACLIERASFSRTSQHTTASFAMRERRILCETQRRLERTFVHSFRTASFATRERLPRASRETRLERRLFPNFRTAFFARHEMLLAHDASLERTQVQSVHASWNARHETRRQSTAELRHRSEIVRERVRASEAPDLVWRKRETAVASPAPGETIEIRKHIASKHTVQTLSAPAPARAHASLLDRATMERLAEDVISRIERRLRLERERRGL